MTRETRAIPILVNESAGRAAAVLETVERETSERDRRIVRCGSPEAMRREIERAAEEKLERVIVAGGDGTVSMAARAMREAGAPGALAVLPAGTGNDLARSLGVPLQIDRALTLAIGGEAVMIDAMKLEGAEPRLCVNAVTVRRRTAADDREEDEEIKDWLGRASYWIGALSNVATAEPFRVRIRTGSVDTEIGIHGFALCNGRTAGGGTTLAPQASLDDGKLDLVLFPEQPLTSALATAFGVATGMNTGECARLRVEEASVEADVEMIASIDGEIAQETRIRAAVDPGVFRFVVGPDAAIEQGA